jgi:YVTN family beta-propeller protein
LPPGESRIYVANRDDDSLTTYLPSFNSSPPTTLNLPAGSHPVYLASTESGKMYVADAGTNTVGVVNGLQSSLTTVVPVGSTPVALAETPDGKKLYALNQGDGTVSVIDTATDTVLHTVIVGTSPIWALFSPDNQELYVLNQGSGTVSVINATTDTLVTSLSAGTSPAHMFVDTHLNRLYVVDAASSNNLWIFDASVDPPKPLTSLTVQPDPKAAVPPLPTSVTVLASGQKAYVASFQPNSPAAGQVTVWMSVINATSNTVQKTQSFPAVPAICNPGNVPFTQTGGVRFPAFVASSSNSNRVYISSCDAGVIHVVSTTNDSFVTDIASPVSALPPPTPTSPPPPQQPVFVLAGP